MDEIQPDIVISDWYAAREECGSKYEICVELLSQNKKVIREFCPEPVYIEKPIDPKWRQMTHVFRDYGRGVRFVRFCHGGMDTQYCPGWNGIRVTNSSVEICPSADNATLWREECRRDRFWPHSITWRNLLKNPSAEEGFNGWQILENGGDKWATDTLAKYRPEGTATKFFVTSFDHCKKCQLIDLVEEGYSQSFMDEIQPDIVISDWYSPHEDCGSKYEICVELLSQNKKVIREFCPEPVYIVKPIDPKWRQMTHVFWDYGRGVRFVRFCHGGRDTKVSKGWFGIRVTNSSLEICPSADSAALWRERCRRDRFWPRDITTLPTDWQLFYSLCKNRRNLLKNPSADEEFNGWQILENGGDKWRTEPLSEPPDGTATKYFATSFKPCKKCQLINLVKEGYSPLFMDEIQPDIVISDWYAPFWYCGSNYEICVELLSRNKEVIRKFCPEPVCYKYGNDQKWRQMTHVFRDYGRDVRFVRFCHGGTGTEYCTYWNGIRVTNSSVEICPSADNAALWRERCRRDRFLPHDITRRNLLKNPSADEGFYGWQILENGGKKWRVEPLFETPDGTASRFFVTSGSSCKKCQLIDLVKEGYSQSFMDEIQPDIVISDWYAPRWDCGSMYEICVELLSRNKKVICKFCPEPVRYKKWNDQKWRQMTHVFRAYGRGVCFVRFCHGGNDMTGGGSWFGIRVTNSSVEICPSADNATLWPDRVQPHDITRPPLDWGTFYTLCEKRRNLLKNPSAEEEFNGWQILENGGKKWRTEPLSEPPDGMATKYFATSFKLCKKCQLIDLVEEGYSPLFMDEIQPDIVISDWYAPFWYCGSNYEICVELLSQNKEVIREFCPEPVCYGIGNDQKWRQMTHVFRDYGRGVCFVRFCHGGVGTEECYAWNGIRVTNSSVEICPSADNAALWRERCRRDRFQPHDITRRNLLKNPSADEGFYGWQILENGGDKWRVEPLFETPEGTATKFFVTSKLLCKKWQLIDLVKEGYSQSFMDENQPDIVISDWYAPRWDCGSMYEICVELLSQNKEVIRKFCPEPVRFEQWNDQKWRQMTHVFRDYGRGVCFIKFCHGGKDMKGWGGWYGIRVTNSSVEICPSADSAALWREGCRQDRFQPHDITRHPISWELFYFLCNKRRNLLKNPGADEGFNGWQILENGGDHWGIQPIIKYRPEGTATNFFVTSSSLCKKCQLIDLVKEGYSQSIMDEIQPDIVISDWYSPHEDCGSKYEICVELLSQNKKVIREFCPEPVYIEKPIDPKWRQMTHVFRDYEQGVRFVRFCHGGQDTKNWKGRYGIRVTNSSVEICPSAPV